MSRSIGDDGDLGKPGRRGAPLRSARFSTALHAGRKCFMRWMRFRTPAGCGVGRLRPTPPADTRSIPLAVRGDDAVSVHADKRVVRVSRTSGARVAGPTCASARAARGVERR